MNIDQLKNNEAVACGYPNWKEMENFIIDNNSSVVTAQLLVSAMDRILRKVICPHEWVTNDGPTYCRICKQPWI